MDVVNVRFSVVHDWCCGRIGSGLLDLQVYLESKFNVSSLSELLLYKT